MKKPTLQQLKTNIWSIYYYDCHLFCPAQTTEICFGIMIARGGKGGTRTSKKKERALGERIRTQKTFEVNVIC